jgi:hypothetical protein
MLESVTQRYAEGWVQLPDDSRGTLIVRAVNHGVEIGRVEISLSAFTTGTTQGGARQPFRIIYGTKIGHDQPDRVTVEARQQDGTPWTVMRRRLRVGGSYLSPIPPLPTPCGGLVRPPTESSLPGTSFWSEDTSQGASAPNDARPLFVLGSVRSGTTAICQALDAGTRYRGFPEGHVLDLAIRLFGALYMHFDRKERWISPETSAGYHLGRFDRSYFKSEIVALLKRATAGYAAPTWYDKTPTYEMVASVPYLAEIWPEARFLFMKRRGLETIASRLRRFPDSNFEGNCRDWTTIMGGWRGVRDVVSGRLLEIDQLDMRREPAATAERIGQLLGFDSAEVASLGTTIRQARPETTDPLSVVIDDVSRMGWTPQQLDYFRYVCGPEMEAYGYTYDGRYRRTTASGDRSGSKKSSLARRARPGSGR